MVNYRLLFYVVDFYYFFFLFPEKCGQDFRQAAHPTP